MSKKNKKKMSKKLKKTCNFPYLTYYNTKFGKRKTYIVPIQYLLSFCLFALSCRIQHYVDNK